MCIAVDEFCFEADYHTRAVPAHMCAEIDYCGHYGAVYSCVTYPSSAHPFRHSRLLVLLPATYVRQTSIAVAQAALT